MKLSILPIRPMEKYVSGSCAPFLTAINLPVDTYRSVSRESISSVGMALILFTVYSGSILRCLYFLALQVPPRPRQYKGPLYQKNSSAAIALRIVHIRRGYVKQGICIKAGLVKLCQKIRMKSLTFVHRPVG